MLLSLVIFECLSTLVSGALLIESIPRHLQEADHVTLKCLASPAKFSHRRSCQFQWTWQPEVIDQDGDGQQSHVTFPAGASPWWRVVRPDDAAYVGSVIVIDSIKTEQQGQYICRLSCRGLDTESAVITLRFQQDYDLNSKNAQISYIAVGVLFAFIILATVLRFACVNARESCWNSKTTNSNHHHNNQPVQPSWLQHLNHCSTDRVRCKPKLAPRPTVLNNTVWLPPYEAALRHTRLVHSPGASSDQSGSAGPPTYEEALSLMQTCEGNGNIQTV